MGHKFRLFNARWWHFRLKPSYEGVAHVAHPDRIMRTHSSPAVLFSTQLKFQVTRLPTGLRVGLNCSLDCMIDQARSDRNANQVASIPTHHSSPDTRDSLVCDSRQVKQPSGSSHFWTVMVFVWQIDHILYTCRAKTEDRQCGSDKSTLKGTHEIQRAQIGSRTASGEGRRAANLSRQARANIKQSQLRGNLPRWRL